MEALKRPSTREKHTKKLFSAHGKSKSLKCPVRNCKGLIAWNEQITFWSVILTLFLTNIDTMSNDSDAARDTLNCKFDRVS